MLFIKKKKPQNQKQISQHLLGYTMHLVHKSACLRSVG